MMRAPRPIRNVDAGDLIEMMLVVAVTTIVIIRIILELSGYPKLGGSGLHIAHVLYGGLMMIAALILVFALLNMSAQWAAAFVGGVGFGFFIDEVGKFISNDVNYFFEPAFAVMYVVFIILFFALWAIRRAALRPRRARERPEPAARGARRDARRRDQAGDPPAARPRRPADALVPVLRERVRATPTIERRNLTPYARWRTRLAEWYQHKAEQHWFSTLVLVVMIIYGLGSLGTVVSPFTDGEGVDGDSHDFATWFETGVRRRHGDPHRYRPRRAAPLSDRVVPLVQGGDPGLPADHAGLRLLLRPALGPGRRDRRPAPVRRPLRT